MNAITLQIPHLFWTFIFNAYTANYLATLTITMLTVIQESKVSASIQNNHFNKFDILSYMIMWSWASKKTSKHCVHVSIQDGIGYLFSYVNFLHAQYYISIEFCSLDSN